MCLEPHVGFLHGLDYGRPSLALDVVQPFRASVGDGVTLTLPNLRTLTTADFEWSPETWKRHRR